jgi:OmcA/MtrC family decaheme c-type cytochrome
MTTARRVKWLVLSASFAVATAAACNGDDGKAGPPGEAGVGQPGQCSVTTGADGCSTITCDDGTTTKVCGGADGGVGTCTVVDNPGAGAGCKTITCSDGTIENVCNGTNPDASVTAGPGLNVKMSPSAPANGTHFVAGDKIVVTIELADAEGSPLTVDKFSTLGLYMNGPRDVVKTVAAVKLLNTTIDRTVSDHHYVNLLTTTNTNLVVTGNVLTYTMEAVTDEAPGTYTVGFRAMLKGSPQDQKFELSDVQIGTATVEPLIVGVADTAGTGGCADCHKGAANGQFYMRHVDPSGNNSFGSPAIDSVPVRTCKNCHNQEGYAAVRKCTDGSKPDSNGASPPKYICADGTENWTYMSDPIVRRVHGVHMGSKLLSAYSAEDFVAYQHTVFPSGIKNCIKCHNDDAWKTKPSRVACGACHDNLNFTNGKYEPAKPYTIPFTGGSGGKCVATSVCSVGTCNLTSGVCECSTSAQCAGVFSGFNGVCNAGKCELQDHGGGPQADDTGCKGCHTAGDTGLAPIAVVHKVPPPVFKYSLDVTMTPPANGTHYVAGEAPTVKVVIKDTATGSAIDHQTVTQAGGWASSYLFVNGPRGRRIPQLTSAARPETTSSVGPWDLTAAVDFQLNVGSTALKIAVPTTLKKVGATAAEAVAWLNSVASFKAVAFATENAGAVTILARPSPKWSQLEILAGTVTTALGFTAGVYTEKAASTSYAANSIYKHTPPATDDPKAAWTAADITYELDDVATAEPGTYTLFVRVNSTVAGAPHARKLLNFQVGTATADKLVATNCKDCHGDSAMHGYAEFAMAPDVCGSCHDYRRQARDRTASDTWIDGWGGSAPPSSVIAGRGNMGYGPAPIARRVHGVHFLNYLNKPAEVHSSLANEHFIFPQDVRNCVKCHSETPTWSEKPGRVPCNACHDSDAAKAHTALMTLDPTPVDPWNGDEQQSCTTCHGAGKDFAVEKMHNITNPYVPPYPRE